MRSPEGLLARRGSAWSPRQTRAKWRNPMHLPLRRASAIGVAAALAVGGAAATSATAMAATASPAHHVDFIRGDTATPIKHLVVIFQENVSFDHYFGTYPFADNTSGQTFTAKRGTPQVNGLTPALLTTNPNGANPARYDPTNINHLLTCDQDHNYHDEQAAMDGGKMDKFITSVGNGGGTGPTRAPRKATQVPNL